MSALYVILAIVAALGLVAVQMLVLRYKGMEYATASLQARATRPRVLIRTLSACLISTLYVVACCIVFPTHPPSHGSIFCLVCCVPAVIFYLLVRVPPVWLIAAFGSGAARVIWSIFFGVSLPFTVILLIESLEFRSTGLLLW